MAFPYKKILVPIDFEDNSLRALDEAVKLARHFNASVALVHVVALVVPMTEVPTPMEMLEEQAADARKKLDQIALERAEGVEHHQFVYTGDVVGGLLQTIGTYQPDLVVMATHGRRGLSRFLLGSVAEAIVRKAPCPVMTVRQGKK